MFLSTEANSPIISSHMTLLTLLTKIEPIEILSPFNL